MAFSLVDLKRAKVASFRDVADALDGMATANRDMQRGVAALPIMGDAWKGVSGDAAHHELDGHGKYLGGAADAQHGAAARVRRAADEFEGVQQLLKKIENDAAQGKFTIDLETGKVTPPKGDYDKSELDYLTNTLKQLRAAGETANTDLEAAVKAAKELPTPSGAAGALPVTPDSTTKPGGAFAGVENLAGPNPDGDPGATKAAAAPSNLSELDRLNKAADNPASGPGKPGADAKLAIDPRQAGGLLGNPAVGDARQGPAKSAPPTPMAPKLDPNNPADKAAIDKVRSFLQATVPPDQVESRMAEVIKGAQQDRPMVAVPEPVAPERVRETFSDAFHDSWDKGIKGIQDMVGANGIEAAKDVWGDMGAGIKGQFTDLGYQLDHPGEFTPQQIDRAHEVIDNPKAFLGEQSAIAAQAIPGLMFGGEGAAVRAGLPAELVTEGGAPRALLRDWNATGGMPWKDFETQFGRPETRIYPLHDGFPEGYVPKSANLPAGTIIDRFGSEGGRYLAPDGTPFSGRALAPETVGGEYNRYMLTGKPLPPGIDIVEGPVQPWFGQTPAPGVPQYMIVGPPGVNVKELVDRGVLDDYGPPIGR